MLYGEQGEKYQGMEKTSGIWYGEKNIAVYCKYGDLKNENNFKKRVFS